MLEEMIMQDYLINRVPMAELLRNLSEDIKIFFKQETKLVKKEMMEKASQMGRHAMILGIGGLMAGMGGMLLLASLGFLIAYAFQSAGLDPLLAVFLGFVSIGLLVVIVGAAISIKGIKAISKDSLTPQRTIHTVTGVEMPPPGAKKPEEKEKEPSASELHDEALATKQRIEEEQHELKHRLKPSQLKKRAIGHIVKHPYSWGAVGLACALTGGYLVRRKIRKAQANGLKLSLGSSLNKRSA